MSKRLVDHLIKTNYNGINDKIKSYRKPKKKGAQKQTRNSNSKYAQRYSFAYVKW